MWGTDLTTTLTGEGQAAVFIAVDHASTECVGIHAARRGTAVRGAGAAAPGHARLLRRLAQGIAVGLKLRHDHGSQFVAHDYQRELAFLGIESSPAFVREPEGNGCAERFIRTLKENLLWVRRFDTIEDLRLALMPSGDLQLDLARRSPATRRPPPSERRKLRRSQRRHEPATRCLITVDRYSHVCCATSQRATTAWQGSTRRCWSLLDTAKSAGRQPPRRLPMRLSRNASRSVRRRRPHPH